MLSYRLPIPLISGCYCTDVNKYTNSNLILLYISGCYCTDVNKYSNSNLIVGSISGCYWTDVNKYSNSNLILGYISGCYCTDVNKYSNSNLILGYTLEDLKLSSNKPYWSTEALSHLQFFFHRNHAGIPIIDETLMRI